MAYTKYDAHDYAVIYENIKVLDEADERENRTADWLLDKVFELLRSYNKTDQWDYRDNTDSDWEQLDDAGVINRIFQHIMKDKKYCDSQSEWADEYGCNLPIEIDCYVTDGDLIPLDPTDFSIEHGHYKK